MRFGAFCPAPIILDVKLPGWVQDGSSQQQGLPQLVLPACDLFRVSGGLCGGLCGMGDEDQWALALFAAAASHRLMR